MSAEAGGAKPYLVAAVLAALVLMVVAIAVTVLASNRPAGFAPQAASHDADPTAVASLLATPVATPTPTVEDPPAASTEARPLIVPALIAAREPLPFCGHETVNRTPQGDFRDAEAWVCFIDAHDAGRTAELIRDSFPVEGGHIREILRLRPSREIEVWYDSTQDDLSARQWTHAVCGGLVTLGADPAGTPIQFPDECATGEILIETDQPDVPTGAEMAMLEQLVQFAREPDAERLAAIPLSSDGLWLGLADELVVRRTPEQLADPGAWRLGVEFFRERIGPFSALDLLADWNAADAFEVRELAARLGEYEFCFRSPEPRPPQMDGRRRLSLQPVFIGPAPCLAYWTVDVFVGVEGRIEAISVDMGDP